MSLAPAACSDSVTYPTPGATPAWSASAAMVSPGGCLEAGRWHQRQQPFAQAQRRMRADRATVPIAALRAGDGAATMMRKRCTECIKVPLPSFRYLGSTVAQTKRAYSRSVDSEQGCGLQVVQRCGKRFIDPVCGLLAGLKRRRGPVRRLLREITPERRFSRTPRLEAGMQRLYF